MPICPLCKGAGRINEKGVDCFICSGKGIVTEKQEDEFMTEDGMDDSTFYSDE